MQVVQAAAPAWLDGYLFVADLGLMTVLRSIVGTNLCASSFTALCLQALLANT
jgi:hypothetical protein